jgi:putative hemolysin
MTLSSTLLCLFLISCSFVLSSSEIALFSLSRVQLKRIKDESEPLFRRIRTLIHDSMGLLITVLLFNEIVNISLATILTTRIVEPLHLDWRMATLLGILITTPVMLIACELTPKVIASKANQMIISTFLPLVYPLYLLMRPLVAIIRFLLPAQPVRELHQLHEEDFIIIAEEQTETGQLHETELELIKNVFEMDDTRVEQLATSIKRITTVPSGSTLEQAAQIALKDRIYSRIPVYDREREDIVGVLNTKDLVEIKVRPEMKTENVMTLANEPLIVAGTLTLDAVFRKMKSKKIQVAFTRGQNGKISGMITIQDILDTLIEEAFEE